jgi:glycine dehydrogenase subunit 1
MGAPHVPHTETEVAEMLGFLGLDTLEDLFQTVPAAIRLAGGLDLPDQWSEADLLDRLDELARKNRPAGRDFVCFAGAGAYDHEVPAVVKALAGRSEFVTAYTPYQPEVAQGVLQALFEYQTLIARLTGLEIANASLYDGATSLVEAVNLAAAATGNQRIVCSDGVNARWRRTMETFAKGTKHQVERVTLRAGVTDWSAVAAGDSDKAAAVVVATPNFLGCLEDLTAAKALADKLQAKLVVCFDPVAAGVLKTPGSLGADLVVGEGQPFGQSLNFGGPYLGIFTCRLPDVRRLPGRLVGETVDTEGRHAYVTTLRAREQDIRREKASSNVCTNQTLMAVTAAIQLGWLGTAGLRDIALRSARAARYTREALTSIDGVEMAAPAATLREFAVKAPVPASELIERLMEEGFLGGVAVEEGFEGTEYEGALLVATTERRTRSEIDAFAAAFQKAVR